MSLLIMGGDVSMKATGLCLPNGACTTIPTDTRRGDQRLVDIRRAFLHYTRTNPCDLFVIEELSEHAPGALSLISSALAQSVIREVLAEHGTPVAYVRVSTLKRFATGNGHADKREMVAAANLQRPDWVPDLVDDNQADAWWLRAMGLWWAGDRSSVGEHPGTVAGSDQLRDRCVFGPWDKTPGAKWPGRGRLPQPGHPGSR